MVCPRDSGTLTAAALLAAPLALSTSARAQHVDVSLGLYVGAGLTQAQWDASKFD